MGHEVSAELEGSAIHGRWEGIVNDQGQAVLMGDCGHFSISSTTSAGLASISAKIALVLGRSRLNVSRGCGGRHEAELNVGLFKVLLNSDTVPPYRLETAMIKKAAAGYVLDSQGVGVLPELVATAATPPSNAAIFFSKQSTVGFARRV